MRFNNHIKGIQSNIKLQNAINKYYLQDFIFIVFEYCEPDKLILRERFYIDELKPEYNILKVAGSSLGLSHSDEAKHKMSESRKGKLHSAKTKALMSIPKSEAHKRKISASQGTAIYVYDTQGSLVNTFNSAREAGKHFDCTSNTILKYAKNGNIFKDEWKLSTSLITEK